MKTKRRKNELASKMHSLKTMEIEKYKFNFIKKKQILLCLREIASLFTSRDLCGIPLMQITLLFVKHKTNYFVYFIPTVNLFRSKPQMLQCNVMDIIG